MKQRHAFPTALSAAILISFTLIAGCTALVAGEDLKAGLPANSGYSIEIVGGTNGNMTLTYADVVALGLVKKDDVAHPNGLGLSVNDDYVGVPLLKVIEKAGMPAGEHTYNVTGLDGYSEIFDSDKAGRGIIALKRNGSALSGDPDDPITLILPGGPFCHWIPYPTRIVIEDAKGRDANGTGASPSTGMSTSMPAS